MGMRQVWLMLADTSLVADDNHRHHNLWEGTFVA
jgi:hypothetical protein